MCSASTGKECNSFKTGLWCFRFFQLHIVLCDRMPLIRLAKAEIMSMFGKCALQWPEGFSVVLSSFSSCECWRLCRLKPLSQANDDCIISKQLMTFSFILTGSCCVFLRFYTLFLPFVSVQVLKSRLHCVFGGSWASPPEEANTESLVNVFSLEYS